MNQNNINKNKKNILLKSIIYILILGIFFISIFGGYGCRKSDQTVSFDELSSSQVSTTVSSKFLNVGVDATLPPFAYLEGEEVKGFDIDLATEIAKRIEKELKIIQISYSEIYDKINQPEIDIIISAIIPNDEKSKIADFSIPYYTLEYIFITLNTSKFTIGNDLLSKKIGLIKSEVENLNPEFLLKYSISKYDDAVALINALKSQEIDAILISAPIGIRILNDDPQFYRFIEKIKSNANYCIVIKKDTGLKEEIDETLKDINEDGTFQLIYDKWLKQY